MREAVEHKFPTASFAQLRGPDSWSDWTAGLCALSRFVRPRDLDPGLGPDAE
jgi:phosphohistidine phosphatase